VSDRFVGKAGNDVMLGGRGNDTYTFSTGFGSDRVIDQDSTAGNFDRIVFTDIRATDVDVTAAADHLTIRVKNTNDAVDVQWLPDAGAVIESIQFTDEVWNVEQIQARFRPAAQPPGLVSPLADQQVNEDQGFAFEVPAGAFVDPDGDALVLSATLDDGRALPSWLRFDGTRFSGVAGNENVGQITVRVTATDPGGKSVSDDFNLFVANTNDAPVVAAPLADQMANEDSAFSYTVPATTFTDVDAGDQLTYVATLDKGAPLPAWLTFDAATRTFSGTPANADVGTYHVHVFARDQAGALAEDVLDIVVANVNDAPTLAAPLADFVGREGHAFEIELPPGTFQDIDAGDTLTYRATLANGDALPPWLSFDPETLTLTGDPQRADIGSFLLRVTVIDTEGATAFDDFKVTIQSVPGMVLVGGGGNDVLTGDSGDDSLNGRGGSDMLYGQAGDDRFTFVRDAIWADSVRRTNVGSPGSPGTGETVSLARASRSYDVFDGSSGFDTLVGTSGADAILLDDPSSPPATAAARLIGIEAILAGGGNDVVDLTSTRYALGNVRVEGGAGNDVIWSSSGDDILLGGAGADRIFGGAGADYLAGGGGGDDLNGGLGNDVLQGEASADVLLDAAGSNILDGQGGSDDLLDGSGRSFLVGGTGADRITLGGGSDVIAFNRGDGRDVIRGSGSATLSLGGGIRYTDLALRKSANDLVVEVGAGERLTFRDWYASPDAKSVLNLQVIAEVMQGYNPASSNALMNRKVQSFDFGEIVGAFDAARAANPRLSQWSVMNVLLDAHLGGNDAAALGGDLAYQYGKTGSLAGIGLAAAQGVITDASFGTGGQALQSANALGQGPIKLS
jgi:Ca2+-binding RTX toxin-like protein